MQDFRTFEGNSLAKKRLEKMLQTGKLPHLLLFSGPSSSVLQRYAHSFANSWLELVSGGNSTFPSFDLHVLRPEGKTGMFGIQNVREVITTLQKAPYQASGKVALFEEAERMLPTSANTLLKLLEEPPKRTLIILCSSRPERLLPTIVSRSQRITFDEGHKRIEASDDLTRAVLNLLFEIKWDFPTMVAGIKNIVGIIQEKQKAKEEALREEIKTAAKEMNAASKELLEQEIEGMLALVESYCVDSVLRTVLMFYRDMQLAATTPQKTFFFEPHREMIIQALNSGRLRPLDEIMARSAFAKKAFERGSPLQNILEHLFF